MLKQHFVLMIMVSYGAIVTFELYIHLEKGNASRQLLQSDTSVGNFPGTKGHGAHVENTNQTQYVAQALRDLVNISDIESVNISVIESVHISDIESDVNGNQTRQQNANNSILLDKTLTVDHAVGIYDQPTKNITAVDLNQTHSTKRLQLKWNGNYDQTLNNTEQYRSLIHSTFYMHLTNHYSVNCSGVVLHNKREIAKAKVVMAHTQRRGVSIVKYTRIKDCEGYRSGRGYIEHPLSQIELDFPLAFGILIYKDVEQAERLLRSIYRPHNVYCIHLDKKIKPIDRAAMQNIAKCLDNVFVSDTSINVTWGEYSLLEAELVCMKDVQQYKRWKYYINLTGQEFPLKTNKEIVSILKSLRGANVVDGTYIRARERYLHRWRRARKPPHNIRPIKGSVHVAVNRQFVDFALNDYRAHDLLKWLKRTKIPDETFFATLNHNPSLGINGSFLGEPEEYPLKPSFIRYKNWQLGHSVYVRQCSGKFVRNICILGVGDLHQAYSDIGLFANKLHIDFEYLALDCLEEILNVNTWSEYLKDEIIDTGYYEHLDYVKKRLIVPT